jgi:hypothetical protein
VLLFVNAKTFLGRVKALDLAPYAVDAFGYHGAVVALNGQHHHNGPILEKLWVGSDLDPGVQALRAGESLGHIRFQGAGKHLTELERLRANGVPGHQILVVWAMLNLGTSISIECY